MTNESFRVPLRWRDLDNQGHVYHAEYLTLLDQARTAWLQTCLGVENPDEYVIVHIDIDYLNELTVGSATNAAAPGAEAAGAIGVSAVDVSFTIKRLGNKSLTTEEIMTIPDGTKIARASAVLLIWNRTTRQTRALNDIERDLVAPYLAPVGSEA